MIILGIDPGLTHCGWGIVSSSHNALKHIANGTIKPPGKLPLAQRLLKIEEELSKVLELYHPQKAAIEETFVNKGAQTSLKLGAARGVAMLVPARAGLDVAEYSPNLIKKSIVGAGHADKNQIMTMVKMLLPMAEIDSEHSADALAIAITHANHHNSVMPAD